MSETMVVQMIRFRRDAAKRHCRVKRWRLTEAEAIVLADEIKPWGDAITTVEAMRLGTVRFLGAQIMVKP